MKRLPRLMTVALLGAAACCVNAAEIWNHDLPVMGMLRWNGFETGSTTVNVVKSNTPQVTYNGSGGQYSGYFYTDGEQSPDEFFRFFCIDLFQVAATGPFPYTASTYQHDALARLYDIAYPNKASGDFFDGGQTDFGLFATGVFSSAFQLAVWEIVYEDAAQFSLTGGTFRSKTAANGSGTDAQQAVAQAELWLAAVNGGAGSAEGWTLLKFSNEHKQDYLSAIYREPLLTTASVPEPGTLALFGIGVAAFGASRRRS